MPQSFARMRGRFGAWAILGRFHGGQWLWPKKSLLECAPGALQRNIKRLQTRLCARFDIRLMFATFHSGPV